jgi:hypothetical protein
MVYASASLQLPTRAVRQGHSGARASANPESRANNFWIPGSFRFAHAPE